MRNVHWFFVVSTLLFITGIGFIIAGGRAARGAEPQAPRAAPTFVAVATVKQIMDGIVAPAASAVFDSVSVTMTTAGTVERMPRTDAEWAAVGNAGAALVESGNLLMMPGRAVDTGDWLKMSQALIDSAKVALEATRAKNVDQLFASGEAINESCDNCHTRYQRGS